MDFADWLEQQLKLRDWSPSDLARAANVFPGTITRILNRERNAGKKVARSIAAALKLPEEEVFRRAGLLSPRPQVHDLYFENLSNLWPSLSTWKKRDLVLQARASILNAEAELRMSTELKSPEAHSDIDIIEKLHNQWGNLSEQQHRELVDFLRQVVAEQIRDKKRLKAGGES